MAENLCDARNPTPWTNTNKPPYAAFDKDNNFLQLVVLFAWIVLDCLSGRTSETATKRIKSDRNNMSDDEAVDKLVGGFKKGSIQQIRLKNFLTYTDVVITPGPRLNMVVGPNGTGKSSILNAICLGLGGAPKTLGRAGDVREFIQHGKDKGMVEITLAPGEHTIRREMDRNKGSEHGKGRGASVYYLNDEKVSERDVQKLVADTYHIQVENLCTFLPQDKVGSFSGMSSQGYLEALEQSISTEIYNTHGELIRMEQKLHNSDNDWQALEKKLNSLRQDQERLEVEKERMEEREEALKLMKILEKKRLWLQVEALREQALELRDRRNKAQEELKKLEAKEAPLREELDAVQSLVEQRKQAYLQAKQKASALRTEMDREHDKHDKLDEALETDLLNFKAQQTQEAELANKIESQQLRVNQLDEEMKGMPALEDLEEKLKADHDKFQEIRSRTRDVQRKLKKFSDEFKDLQEDATRWQNKLNGLANESKQRKERVFRNDKTLYQIDKWIQEHASEFQDEVLGPIVCLINPKSEYAAAITEQHVPNRVLRGFVVQNDHDYQYLYQKIRRELNWPINIFNVAGHKPIQRPYSAAKMNILKEKHGIEGYLDQFLECPEPIRQVLAVQSMYEKVLVGKTKTMESIDRNLFEFLSQPERDGQAKRSFVVVAMQQGQTLKFSGSISRYNQELSIRQDDVQKANMLARGSDPDVQKRVEAELKQLHDKMHELRPQLDAARTESDELQANAQDAKQCRDASKERVASRQKFNRKRDVAAEKLENLQKEASQGKDKNAFKKTANILMKRTMACLNALESHAQKQKEMNELKLVELRTNLGRSHIAAKERNIREALDDMKKESAQKKKEVEDIQKEFRQCKDTLKVRQAEAVKIAPLDDENKKPLPLRYELESLEYSTLAEVEAAYEDAETRANDIHDNPEALRKYEEQKKMIEDLAERVEQAKSDKTTETNSIQNLRRGWEMTLDQTVQKINAKFSKYMSDMDCAGEVVLRKGEEGEGEHEGLGNFKDWGIEIRVSFRTGSKLQVLDAGKHSGGERSVSTIMYLMAMQNLMVAPFRCVDEINQGLDERNERLVFKRIVENSTRPPNKGNPTAHAGQ